MTGFAGSTTSIVPAGYVYTMGVLGDHGIATAFYIVTLRGVTGGAGKIQTIRTHVNIQCLLWVGHRGIKITMLHAVTTVTVKMADAAVLTTGFSHMLGNFAEIRSLPDLFAVFGKRLVHIGRMSRSGGKLLIGIGCIVAYQTIDILFRGKIETVVFPAIAYMAACAAFMVGDYSTVEVVDNMLFTKRLTGFGMGQAP